MLTGVQWLQVSMQTLNILQSHYPERLGRAICYHAPRLFNFSWRVQPSTAHTNLVFSSPVHFGQATAAFSETYAQDPVLHCIDIQ